MDSTVMHTPIIVAEAGRMCAESPLPLEKPLFGGFSAGFDTIEHGAVMLACRPCQLAK